MCQIIKYEISICSDLCLPYVHGSLRNVSISPTFTNSPNSIKGKSKLINFKLYNLKVYTFFVATYCFVPSFRKAKSCGVPSRAIVKVGCAVGKKRSRDTGLRNQKFSVTSVPIRNTTWLTTMQSPLWPVPCVYSLV
jgi:hypothetical protein